MSDLASALRMPPLVPMKVLVVCRDVEELRTFEETATHMGDRVTGVADLAEAIAVAAHLQPELAFVDVTLGEGSGLSLVHHLQSAAEGISIYAMAPSPKLDAALEGLTLGAHGMLTLPTTGDAILRALGEVREKRGTARQREFLEAQLAHTRNAIEAMRHMAKLAARGAIPDLMRAVADAVVQVGEARAVSVYQPEGASLARVASSGPVTAPESSGDIDLERFGSKQGRETFALGAGAVVVEGGEDAYRPAIADLTSFASSLVVLAGRAAGSTAQVAEPARFESVARFRDLLGREMEAAARHGRHVSAVCVTLSDPLGAMRRPPAKLKEELRALTRPGDVLGRDEGDDEVWLLLPNTGSLAAQLTRRKMAFGAAGAATFPQDAASADALMRLARARVETSLRSPVRMLDLGRKSLRAIVEGLLACPLLDAGEGSPYPLDLAVPAARSLVHHACIEASRGGPISVLASGPDGAGFAAAARAACHGQGTHDVAEVDLRGSHGDGVDAIVVAAEHGVWTCCGVVQRDRFKAVHAADAMLADLVARKLGEARA